MNLIKFRSFIFLGLLSLSMLAKADDILIKNATVVTSSNSGVINETDILIRDGIISSIGRDISSEDAFIIEASGRIVTPALLAPATNLSLIHI